MSFQRLMRIILCTVVLASVSNAHASALPASEIGGTSSRLGMVSKVGLIAMLGYGAYAAYRYSVIAKAPLARPHSNPMLDHKHMNQPLHQWRLRKELLNGDKDDGQSYWLYPSELWWNKDVVIQALFEEFRLPYVLAIVRKVGTRWIEIPAKDRVACDLLDTIAYEYETLSQEMEKLQNMTQVYDEYARCSKELFGHDSSIASLVDIPSRNNKKLFDTMKEYTFGVNDKAATQFKTYICFPWAYQASHKYWNLFVARSRLLALQRIVNEGLVKLGYVHRPIAFDTDSRPVALHVHDAKHRRLS